MAAITWQQVADQAPQLATVPIAAQNEILAHVNTSVDASILGGEGSAKLTLARIYYAAHFGEIQRRRGQLGMVTSKDISAQGIRVGFMARFTLEPLQATPYGEQYLLIISGSAARVGFVV